METYWLLCFCIFVFLQDLPPQVYAQCDGSSMIYTSGTGEIRNPHYPNDEYNKSANCTWEFHPKSTDQRSEFTVLFIIIQLRLFGSVGTSKRCLESYNLTIGGEQMPCDKYVNDGNETFPCLYSSSSCDSVKEVQKCKTTRQSSFPVSIKYFSDGRTDDSITHKNMHFRISYSIVPCLKVSETTMVHITKTPIQKESRTSMHDVDETSRILVHNKTKTVTSPPSSKITSISTMLYELSTKELTSFVVTRKSSASLAETTSDKTTTKVTSEKDNTVIIIAASAGGGLLILIGVVVACVCSRSRKSHSNGIPLDDQTINLGESEQSKEKQGERLAEQIESKSGSRELVDATSSNGQLETSKSKPFSAATNDAVNIANVKATTLSIPSQPDMYSTIDNADKVPENEMYSTLGDLHDNQSNSEEVSTKSANAPQEGDEMYSTVSKKKFGGKSTEHYNKTLVDNVLYGTSEDI